MSPPAAIVLLCTDLTMISAVRSAARQQGWSFRTADQVESVCLSPGDRIVVDMALPGLDLSRLAAGLSDDQKQTAVLYGPHVQTEQFARARRCGFATVLPRGRFASQITAWIPPAPPVESTSESGSRTDSE